MVPFSGRDSERAQATSMSGGASAVSLAGAPASSSRLSSNSESSAINDLQSDGDSGGAAVTGTGSRAVVGSDHVGVVLSSAGGLAWFRDASMADSKEEKEQGEVERDSNSTSEQKEFSEYAKGREESQVQKRDKLASLTGMKKNQECMCVCVCM